MSTLTSYTFLLIILIPMQSFLAAVERLSGATGNRGTEILC